MQKGATGYFSAPLSDSDRVQHTCQSPFFQIHMYEYKGYCILKQHSSCVLVGLLPVCQWITTGDRLSKPSGIILVAHCIALTWKLLQRPCTRTLNCLSHRGEPHHICPPSCHTVLVWRPTGHRSHEKLFLRFIISSAKNEQCGSYLNLSKLASHRWIWFYFWKKGSSPVRNAFPWRHCWVWSNGLFITSLVNQAGALDPWWKVMKPFWVIE